MTSINNSQLNTNVYVIDELLKKEQEKEAESLNDVISSNSRGTALPFPNLTSRFGGKAYLPTLVMTGVENVNEIETEIEKAASEEEQINTILKANTHSSTFDLAEKSLFSTGTQSGKTIDFTAYTGSDKNINRKTDTTALFKCFTPDTSAGNTNVQKKVFESAVTTMVNWLDNYINNYETIVASSQGRMDAKLSFLLRIRKAIENCDFPVGFAPQSGSAMGSYNWSFYIDEFLNPEQEAFTNRGAEHDLDPKMLLRTDMFAQERKYKTEAEAIAAIDNAIATNNFDFGVEDLIFSNEQAYYQFKGVQLATVLIHEFVHSTHISNEAVTYFTCELMERDFYNESVYTNFSSELLEKAKQLALGGVELNLANVKYSEMTTPVDTGDGVIAAAFGHSLANIDEIAQHGHEMNMDAEDVDLGYTKYQEYLAGNTSEYCKKELLNFVYNA